MKKILLSLSIIFTIFLVTGCFFESVTSIRVVSGIKASWELDEEVDLHSIVIEVVVDSKVTKTVYGDTEGVSIVGLDMSTSGQKTAVVSYEGVSVNISYLVVGNDSLASTSMLLKGYLEDPSITVITLAPGVYDFYQSDIVIKRSVVIRAAAGTNVQLKNVKVLIDKEATASVVEFRNLEFMKGNNNLHNLTVGTSRAVSNDTVISNLDRVVLNNVTVSATGKTDGIKLEGNTHFEMYNSKWITATSDDYFNYMMNTKNGKLKNVLLILENNEFKCNFWYGLGQISQAIIRGNLFEGTIPVDSHLRDDSYAPLYNVNKNPVVFHTSLPESGIIAGQMRLVIENNTFKNVENLFRIYNTDDNSTLALSEDLVFSGNTVTNVNYLVNYSSKAYTKDIVAIVKAGLKTGSQYLQDSRIVIAQNTAITGTMGPEVMTKIDSNTLYKGFVYQEKDTTDSANRYYYIGKLDKVNILAKLVGGVTTYYTITLKYSADGKDTRTITEIINPADITKLNGYKNSGYFTLTEFE